jgi:hypothetical protein
MADPPSSPSDPFEGAPVIFSYTRKQAIEDGVLVDLTEWAREAGFAISVACTSEVWHRYIQPPPGTTELGQSERGRAHDALWLLFLAIRRAASGTDLLMFEVAFLQAPGRIERVQLKATCGPGDEGEPVLTLLTPNED